MLTFGLVLIGKAVDYLPYFIYTFEELGKIGIGKGKGGYELREVSCEGKSIYNSVDRRLRFNAPQPPLKLRGGAEGGGVTTLTLNFITPTRIVFNEDLVVNLEFHQLIRTLLRRISSLSYFHYGERLDLDFKGLIEKAQSIKVKEKNTEWHDWERYSARQDVRMKMGGFVGKVSFEGELGEFIEAELVKAF